MVSTLACLGAPKSKVNTSLHNNCLHVYNHKVLIPKMLQIFLPVSSAWALKHILCCRTIQCHLDLKAQDKVEGPSSIPAPFRSLAVMELESILCRGKGMKLPPCPSKANHPLIDINFLCALIVKLVHKCLSICKYISIS